MPSDLVETYLARGQAGERAALERRARSAAEELARQGTHVRFEHTIHVPENEICFFVFDAPPGGQAALEAQRAELHPLRAVEAVSSGRQVHLSAVDEHLKRSEDPKSDLHDRPGQDLTTAIERRWSVDGAGARSIGSMRAIPVIIGTALVALSLAAAPGAADSSPAAEYSIEVTHICGGALLFEGEHQMGTRADALEIADAIRASTAGRLARVVALSVPPELQETSSRWISSQRRLSSLYARLWVRIYDIIEAARTPSQRATLGKRLENLVHAPDRLKSAARRLELVLHVPDCTGGG